MKKKITRLVLIGVLYFLNFQNSYSQTIKLIGCTSNGQTVDNFVKWNAD